MNARLAATLAALLALLPAAAGADTLAGVRAESRFASAFLHTAEEIARHHHEKWNGSGYPDGLKGDAIPLLPQIMGIVDVYDALTTARPYKEAYSRERACEELMNEGKRGWRRKDLVGAFVALDTEAIRS